MLAFDKTISLGGALAILHLLFLLLIIIIVSIVITMQFNGLFHLASPSKVL